MRRPGFPVPISNHIPVSFCSKPPKGPLTDLHTTTTMATSSSSATNSPYPMPPASADLATTWTFLEEGVDHIMTKLQTGVSYSKYMSLYTVAYSYCTSSRMHGAPDGAVGAGNRSECPGKMLFPITTMTGGLTMFIQPAPILWAQICTTTSFDTLWRI